MFLGVTLTTFMKEPTIGKRAFTGVEARTLGFLSDVVTPSVPVTCTIAPITTTSTSPSISKGLCEV